MHWGWLILPGFIPYCVTVEEMFNIKAYAFFSLHLSGNDFVGCLQ